MRTILSFLVFAVLLSASFVMGQDNVRSISLSISELSNNYYGGGARAMAMGNAFVGLANDVNGGSWNPAGIYQIEKPIISFSYNSFNNRGIQTHEMPLFSIKNITEDDKNLTDVGHFSLVVPLRIKGKPWVFSFNYVRNNDQRHKMDMKTNLISNLDPDTFIEDESHLKTYNFGMSTRIYNRLSFGALVNIYNGRSNSSLIRQEVYDSTVPPYGIEIIEVFHEYGLIDTTTSNGFNFTLGLMYKLDKISFGAVMRTPFVMNNSSDYAIPMLTTNNGLVYTYGTRVVLISDSLSKQDTPLSLAFGIGVTPNKKTTIALDFNFQKYGSVNYHNLESIFISAGGKRKDTYSKIPIKWNNTIGVGSGVEYLWDTKFGQIPLRAGYRYDQLPPFKNIDSRDIYDTTDVGEVILDEYTTEVSTSGRLANSILSFGTGIHWSLIDIDIVYRITSGAIMEISESLSTGDRSRDVLIINQEIEQKSNDFRITFTGRF